MTMYSSFKKKGGKKKGKAGGGGKKSSGGGGRGGGGDGGPPSPTVDTSRRVSEGGRLGARGRKRGCMLSWWYVVCSEMICR